VFFVGKDRLGFVGARGYNNLVGISGISVCGSMVSFCEIYQMGLCHGTCFCLSSHYRLYWVNVATLTYTYRMFSGMLV